MTSVSEFLLERSHLRADFQLFPRAIHIFLTVKQRLTARARLTGNLGLGNDTVPAFDALA